MLRRLGLLLVLQALQSISGGQATAVGHSFTVAEVKPHYGCTDPNGQDKVRRYISDLVAKGTGLISLIEFEFSLEQPQGYTVLGGNCKDTYQGYDDPVVVLVDESQFSIVSGLGQTLVGNYSSMPFLSGGKPDVGLMCVANASAQLPDGRYVGTRPYAGAVLLHKDSGTEICVLTATFPHCNAPWNDQFLTDVERCGSRQLLIIADTNAGCESSGGAEDSSRYSLGDIAANHSANWGPSHDPGQFSDPTCCNDSKKYNITQPTNKYDRTAVFRGGFVDQFEVAEQYVCGADEEHRFTSARVWIANNASAYCLDHAGCASLDPLDGLCCPVANGVRLDCCDQVPTGPTIV